MNDLRLIVSGLKRNGWIMLDSDGVHIHAYLRRSNRYLDTFNKILTECIDVANVTCFPEHHGGFKILIREIQALWHGVIFAECVVHTHLREYLKSQGWQPYNEGESWWLQP